MKNKEVRASILKYMKRQANRPVTAGEIASALKIGKGLMRKFERQLARLERNGDIVRTRTGRYAIPERLNLVVGTIHATATGNAFVDSEEDNVSVYIEERDVGDAVDGDRVVCRVHKQARQWKRAQGSVVRILDRRSDPVVGTFKSRGKSGYVVPDRNILHSGIVVSDKESLDANAEDKVVVEITRYPESGLGPEGRIVEVIGQSGDPGVDITAVVRRLGLPEQFSAKVVAAVEKLPESVCDKDVSGRLDLRSRAMVTIDGPDAKDYDDAVSLQREGDNWRLGVHIADVSHYVPSQSVLDREARKRGTSVYLVDRTIHMFPTQLSQGIASLQAGKDRLAMSVFITVSRSGEMIDYQFDRSAICVNHRLTYDQVNDMLDGDDSAVPEDVVTMLTDMAELARVLSDRRHKNGSIGFEVAETHVTLDEQGKPVDVRPRRRGISEGIIEEFMIAANQAVAEFLSKQDVPGVYRIHLSPDDEDIDSLKRTLGIFGLKLSGKANKPLTYQKLLSNVKGRTEEHLISTLVLRSMQKARYWVENEGHFALAAKAYTHFTSPIRRYSDLVVHRLLWRALSDKVNQEFIDSQSEVLPRVCDHSSAMEVRAEEVERETTRLKVLEYMADKLGEEYSGVISGVTPYGFYVRLANTAEGFVHVSTLIDDFYRYDEDNVALMGRRRKRRFRLGDEVKVWLAAVDRSRHELEMELIQ